MNDLLWRNFLEQEVEDLQIVILTIGIHGLLAEFEFWLSRNDYLTDEAYK